MDLSGRSRCASMDAAFNREASAVPQVDLGHGRRLAFSDSHSRSTERCSLLPDGEMMKRKPTNKQEPLSLVAPTGLDQAGRRSIADALCHTLADTYSLYLKTQGFHWNVTGPMFPSLHLMFEQQYTELALAIDLIAERIRALGFPAPGSFSQLSRLTTIPEEKRVPRAEHMVQQLLEGHRSLIRNLRRGVSLADHAGDAVTVDLLTQRLQVHEKTGWMLSSLMEQDAAG